MTQETSVSCIWRGQFMLEVKNSLSINTTDDVGSHDSLTPHPLWMGTISLPNRRRCRFSYSVVREAGESWTTCWAESYLHPHRKRKLLHTDVRLLKCHFLSLRHDGVCRCVSGVVGWRSWRCRGMEATAVPSRVSDLLGKQIWHRWSVWREKDPVWQQDKKNRWTKKDNPPTTV